MDQQLLRTLREEVADTLARQRREDAASGLPLMSTEDERQFARAVIARVLESHARREIAEGRAPMSAAEEAELADGIHAARQATRPEHDGRLAMNDFRNAFEKLPDEQREALILVGASGFSYEEAASMTGVAVGTVKSRANRGRRRLAELLHMAAGEELDMTDRATMAVMAANHPVSR